MKQNEFRKLKVDLPLQQPTNEGPWLIAGVFLAFVVLSVIVFRYLQYKGLL